MHRDVLADGLEGAGLGMVLCMASAVCLCVACDREAEKKLQAEHNPNSRIVYLL